MQSVAKTYIDSSDDEKSSSTARAREARLKRRQDRVNARLSSSLPSNEDNNDNKISSLTSTARDARKNRYGSGLNDISNTVRKEETTLLRKDHHSSSLQSKPHRPLVVPDIQKTTTISNHSPSATSTYTTRSNKTTNPRSSDAVRNNTSTRSKSISSHRSENSRTTAWSKPIDNVSINPSDSDDDEVIKKSGTAIAREVRMNRSLANAINTRTATQINDTNPNDQSNTLSQTKEEPARVRHRGRSRTHRGGVQRAKKDDADSGDSDTVISLGSIYRNGSSRPPSQSRVNKSNMKTSSNDNTKIFHTNEGIPTRSSSKSLSKQDQDSNSSKSDSIATKDPKARYVVNAVKEEESSKLRPPEFRTTSILPTEEKNLSNLRNQNSSSRKYPNTRITVTTNPPNTSNPTPRVTVTTNLPSKSNTTNPTPRVAGTTNLPSKSNTTNPTPSVAVTTNLPSKSNTTNPIPSVATTKNLPSKSNTTNPTPSVATTKNLPSKSNTTNPTPPTQRKPNNIMSTDFDDAIPSTVPKQISSKNPKYEARNTAPSEQIEKEASSHDEVPVVSQPSIINYGHILTDFGSNEKGSNEEKNSNDPVVSNAQILKDLDTKEDIPTKTTNTLPATEGEKEAPEKVEKQPLNATTTLPEITKMANTVRDNMQNENRSYKEPARNKVVENTPTTAHKKMFKEEDLLTSSQVIALPPPSPVRNIRNVLNPNHPIKYKMSEIDANAITLTPPPPSMAEIKQSFSADQNDWVELLDNVTQPTSATVSAPMGQKQETIIEPKPHAKPSNADILFNNSKEIPKKDENLGKKNKDVGTENDKKDSENNYLSETTSAVTNDKPTNVKESAVPRNFDALSHSQYPINLKNTAPVEEERKVEQWDYTNSRWNQFEKDENLERDVKEASAKAILNAVEEAANRDILNSPSPEKTGESVMVLPILNEGYDNDESLTSLDFEADLEKSTRAKHLTDKNDEWKSRPVSTLFQKLTNAGIATDSEEENDFELNRLTSNGMSLDEPSSHRRVKEEKPWSKSLKRKVTSGVDKVRNMTGSNHSGPKVQQKSAHDLVREEALRMLNLADSVGTTSGSRRSSSVADKARQTTKNFKEKILQTISSVKPNYDSDNSADTDVVNNSRTMSVGDFSIDDSDDDDVDKYRSVREKVEVEEEDLTVLYDKNDFRQEKPTSNWSSRFSGSTLPSSLSMYMKGYQDIKQKPVSARGMMWATPQDDDVSITSSKLLREVNPTLPTFMQGFSYSSGLGQPPMKEPSRFRRAINAIFDEFSKVETQKFCALITFVMLLIIGIVTVEVSRSKFSPTPELAQDPSDGPMPEDTNFSPVTFFAISDLGSYDSEILSNQVTNLPSSADFAVHLGDINDASKTLCALSVYRQTESILSKASIPLLVLPGNEDYAACPEPFESLNDWRTSFAGIEKNWMTDYDLPDWIERQPKREENFAFMKNQVLFIGVNIAGKYARDDEVEWQNLDDDNILWTRERLKRDKDHMKALVIFGHARPGSRQYEFYFKYVKQYVDREIPILYIHGDALEDEPILNIYEPFEENGFEMKALEVQRGEVANPVQVTVSSDKGFVITRS